MKTPPFASWSAALLLGTAILLPAGDLRAQPAPAPPKASGIEPPHLVEPVEAAYPESAKSLGIEATVLLRITVDKTGRVTAAEIIEPAGHGFDEAAREAALRLRFEPARQGDRPVAARILYRSIFQPPPPPQPSPPLPPPPPSAPSPDIAPKSPPSPEPLKAPFKTRKDAPLEVRVEGQTSEAEQRRQSAEAVTVVETRTARKQTADLGEVMARVPGVAVRRSGGLGSAAVFSLNGLYDDQIRFFLDGVPLELSGYPFGITGVPLDFVERVEVYRGVVPVRFGADALGGAVNLVTNQTYDTRAAASYQVGSFATYRAALQGRYRHDASGFVVSLNGFVDHSNNNYLIDVQAPDDKGRLSPVRVPRFHDAYTAFGGAVEVGFVDRPWAKRLLLRLSLADYDKDLQHNTIMTIPYGEVTYGERVYGATARYEQVIGENVEVGIIAGYARRAIDLLDRSEWIYDWYGHRIRPRAQLGELGDGARDQTVWRDGMIGRAHMAVRVRPELAVRASVSPTFATQAGENRLADNPSGRDPLTARNSQWNVVSGLEGELKLFGDRLENVLFVKDYTMQSSTHEVTSSGVRAKERSTHRLGAGDALRFRFTPWLYAKASYEYATRLPRPDELFGNGVLINASLDLEPERSHNVNVGPRLDLKRTPAGDFVVDINGFLRDTDRMIVLLGNDRSFQYQNVYHARSLGIEGSASWVSPGRWVTLDGSITLQDIRNASSEGAFRQFDGDRIPNRPWLFGSAGARVQIRSLFAKNDELDPFYGMRYVRQFFRGWESQGILESKQTVPSQTTHGVGISYTVRGRANITSTIEVQNLTNALVFDVFGVQKPGRSVFWKVVAEIE
ncbi:TonB-dependent receptor [Minicystis rosea]|nr:TonB-dependent receptor [Minicystis rosea]